MRKSTLLLTLICLTTFTIGALSVSSLRKNVKKMAALNEIDDSVGGGVTLEDEQQQKSYTKNVLIHSRRLLRRMQKQHDTNIESLDECYDQLGRYTRLLLAQRSSTSENLTKFVAGDDRVFGFKNYATFMMQSELAYYLNELERNYRVINDLQAKLQALNKTMMSSDNLPFGGSIDRLPSQFPQIGSNRSIPLDCTMVVGTGYIQIDLTNPLNPFSSHHDQLNRHDSAILNKVAVYCEFGWLVIHQRLKGFETNFNRSWKDYSLGFGSLKSDFWLGLEIVHRLTQQKPHELLVELTDWSDQLFIAKYDTFEVSSEQDQYRLGLSGTYSGNASKDFLDDAYNGMSSQNGASFSTFDKWRVVQQEAAQQQQAGASSSSSSSSSSSNSGSSNGKIRNCALRSGGGWWFGNQQTCLPVNLNGVYVNGASAPSTRGIKWQAVRPFDRNYSLKRAKMKIRPKFSAGKF